MKENLCKTCIYDFITCPLKAKTVGLLKCKTIICFAYKKEKSND